MASIEAIYDRQRSMFIPLKQVAVVGVGGVGTWVAIFNAMSGTKYIKLFDSDTVDITNLNRLPFSQEDVGKPKAQVCKEFIKRIRPDCIVMTFPKISKTNLFLLDDCDVVFECTDDYRVQKLVYDYCKEKRIRFWRAGTEGFTVEVRMDVPKALWNPQTGYRIVPTWVCPTVLASLLAVISAYCNVKNVIAWDVRKL